MKPVTGIFLAVVVGVAGAAYWQFSRRATAEDYFRINVSMVRDRLSAADAGAVIFLGDSITLRAPLPARICGHPTVNAGINGIDAATYLSALDTIGDFKAAAIILALGTNNAKRINTTDFAKNFAEDYAALLKTVAARAPVVVLVGLPPIEDGTETPDFDRAAAERINREIQALANRMGSPFVDMRAAMSIDHPLTIDGVHPSSQGFKVWLRAIEPKVAAAMGCS
jgi:lysophospholipase L1-like esterase